MRRSYLSKASWLVLWLVAGTSPMLCAAQSADSDAKGVEFFESQIRPLLANMCYQCHSQESKKAKGGLLLDSREGLLNGGDSGPVIVRGDPDKSLLIKAVRYRDEDLRMPPDGKKLTGTQVADLEAWVKMGVATTGGRPGRQDQVECADALGLSAGETNRSSSGQEPKPCAITGGRVYPCQT